MSEVITRKYVKGILVEETKNNIDWEPNEADLDLITVGCECGNTFEMPWDAMAFCGLEGMHCGQCGKAGNLDVIKDKVDL